MSKWILFFLVSVSVQAGFPVGKVISTQGQVYIKSKDTQDKKKIQSGEPFFEGDTLSTDPLSTAKVLLNDKSVLDLNASATVLIEKYQIKEVSNRQIELSILSGTIRALITKPVSKLGRFNIRRGVAVMGVRGTELVVTQSSVTVLSGKIEYSAPGLNQNAPITIQSGMQLSLEMSKPIALNAGQLDGVAQNSRVQDNTFEKSVHLETGHGVEVVNHSSSLVSIKDNIASVNEQIEVSEKKPADLNLAVIEEEMTQTEEPVASDEAGIPVTLSVRFNP